MGIAALYSDNSFGKMVTGFKAMTVRIIRQARAISAPVETGQRIYDNKVNDPAKVIVRGSVMMGMPGAASAVSTINRMIANRNFEFYSVSNGEDCCNNLILLQSPETRDAERYDILEYELTFTQALFVQAQGSASGENSDTQNNGYVGGKGA